MAYRNSNRDIMRRGFRADSELSFWRTLSMGVYIRGMEMPKTCSVCPMLEGERMDGLCHAASKWLDDDEHWTWYVYPKGDIDDSKPCNCPLVPVPPHGRLIEKNAVFELIRSFPNVDRQLPVEFMKALYELPTIIEAEESET